MNDKLYRPFSREEIRKALFDLNPSKAPRPDGFTTLFFQNEWDTIGDDLTTATLGVLNHEEMLRH